MIPSRARGRVLCVLAGLAGILVAGCATTAPPGASETPEATTLKETRTLVALVREVGWKEVRDLQPLLNSQPAAEFPGVAALAADLRAAAAAAAPGQIPPTAVFDRLTDRSSRFWCAYYEIAPGDPLMAMLQVSLLLAAGEVVRADRVATLAINFGRMDLDYRKELVRLDTYAQLVIHVSGGDGVELDRLRRVKAYAALAAKARAALAVWPQNPQAWADLAWSEQRAAAAPAAGADTAAGGPSLAALRRVDPLFAASAAGPESAALGESRRLWAAIDDDKATGDDEVLRRFSDSAQAAGLDELALVARSLLAGWSEGSLPVDEGFVQASLRRLLSPGEAADVCREAFSESHTWLGLGAETATAPASLEGVSVHPQLEQRLLVAIAATSYWIESGLSQGRLLAENLGERGAAWAQLLQDNVAVADLRHSLQLDPTNNGVRYDLAVALSDAGKFKEADAVFAEARQRSRRNALQTQAWGNHLFKQGRFADAETAFGQAARLDPGLAYAPIMRHLARRRQGKPGGARPDGGIEKADPWGGSLLAFLAGRIDEKALSDCLEPRGGLRHSEQECELYFVLAELALSGGDVAEARRELHSCLGTGITSFVEYAMAWHELRRLNAANPPAPEEKSKSDDQADQQPT